MGMGFQQQQQNRQHLEEHRSLTPQGRVRLDVGHAYPYPATSFTAQQLAQIKGIFSLLEQWFELKVSSQDKRHRFDAQAVHHNIGSYCPVEFVYPYPEINSPR